MSLSSMSKRGMLRLHLRGKQLENLTRQPGSSREPKVPQPSGKYREHHCLSQKLVCNYVQPKQHGLFPDRLKLPFPCEKILSGYEEDVSFQDGTLRRKQINLSCTRVDHLEAHDVPNRSHVQKRQLEPRTLTSKRRSHREANCREMAHHYLAGGD